MSLNDIKFFKNIYMVGIKGVGMSMLAQFLKEKGFVISGSDIADSFQSEKTLKKSKIKYKQGFSLSKFPEKIDLVIYSSAYRVDENIELKYFKSNNFKLLTYAEALGLLFEDYFGISVCGSHGKTTVSSFLAYVLKKSKSEPNALIGSYVKQLGGSSLSGSSKNFIVESDEYQNKLKYFKPKAIVLNNIDFDHPDYFKSEKDYIQVFIDFIKKIPKSGFIVSNMEDKKSSQILDKCPARVIAYYIDKPFINKKVIYKKIYQARNCRISGNKQVFDLFCNDIDLGVFEIILPGRHNIMNSLAVICSFLELGLSIEDLRKNLKTFIGAARRFEILGEYKGAVIIDDYAHHPSEVKAALDAVRQRYPKRKIVTIFHPHTFSRTKALLDDFAKSFTISDDLYLIEIYSSAREKKDDISSLDLIEKIRQYNLNISRKQNIKYFKDLVSAEKFLNKKISKNDVILFLGAGDVFRIAYKWLKL